MIWRGIEILGQSLFTVALAKPNICTLLHLFLLLSCQSSHKLSIGIIFHFSGSPITLLHQFTLEITF